MHRRDRCQGIGYDGLCLTGQRLASASCYAKWLVLMDIPFCQTLSSIAWHCSRRGWLTSPLPVNVYDVSDQDLYEMAVSYPLKWYHQGLFVCVTAMIFRVLHRELYHKCGSYLNYVWPVHMRSPTFFQNSIMGVGVFGRAFFSKRKLNLDVLSCN
jgi:hypothetical protein